jgi:hypothetical protein
MKLRRRQSQNGMGNFLTPQFTHTSIGYHRILSITRPLLCATAGNERWAEAGPCSRREGSGENSALPFFRPTYPVPLKLLLVTPCASPAAMHTRQPKWRVPISLAIAQSLSEHRLFRAV